MQRPAQRGPLRFRGLSLAIAGLPARHRGMTDRITGIPAVGIPVGELLRWEGVPPMFAFRDPDGNGLEVTQEVAS